MAVRHNSSEALVEVQVHSNVGRTPKSPGRISNLTSETEAAIMHFSSPTNTTFPSITDLPSPLSAATGEMQQHPSTGQLEPRVVRRTRLADLLNTLRNATGLSAILRTHLVEADKFICTGKHAEAIPSLEEAIITAKDNPKLQCVLWRILGNAHLSLGHHKKASVCHMHQLAFCREVDDFTGMTMAECNLGISYLKQGLLKLAERCFMQYFENSKILQDEMSVAYACSNLGVLAKSMALQEYFTADGKYRSQKLKNKRTNDKFKEHLHKAIYYFEQHLEIVERHSDLEKQSSVYGNLASCYELLHSYTQAIFCHNKRIEIARSTSNREIEVRTLCNLGNCQRGIGKLEEALENYSLGLEICQTIDDKAVESVILLNLGVTCELTGQLHKAIEWHTLYLSMNVEASDIHGQARAYSILAELYRRTHQNLKSLHHYKKLAEVFIVLGDDDSHRLATAYAAKMEKIIEKEKLVKKYHKINKKSHANGANGASSSAPATMRGDSEWMGWHSSRRTKLRSWSGLRRWNDGSLERPATISWSSNLVLENKHAKKNTLELRRSNLYRTKGIIERLNSQDSSDLSGILKTTRPSFYTLGEFMEPVHHRLSSDDEGTEYEEMEESFANRDRNHPVFGSSRHLKNLRKVKKTLLKSDPSSDPSETPEDEWLQWLQIHNVGPAPPTESTDSSKANQPPPLPDRPNSHTLSHQTHSLPSLSPKKSNITLPLPSSTTTNSNPYTPLTFPSSNKVTHTNSSSPPPPPPPPIPPPPPTSPPPPSTTYPSPPPPPPPPTVPPPSSAGPPPPPPPPPLPSSARPIANKGQPNKMSPPPVKPKPNKHGKHNKKGLSIFSNKPPQDMTESKENLLMDSSYVPIASQARKDAASRVPSTSTTFTNYNTVSPEGSPFKESHLI